MDEIFIHLIRMNHRSLNDRAYTGPQTQFPCSFFSWFMFLTEKIFKDVKDFKESQGRFLVIGSFGIFKTVSTCFSPK